MASLDSISKVIKKAIEPDQTLPASKPVNEPKARVPNDELTKEITGQQESEAPVDSGIQKPIEQPEPEPMEPELGKPILDELTPEQKPKASPAPENDPYQSVNIDDYVPDIAPRSGKIQSILETHQPATIGRAKVIDADLSISNKYLMDEPIHINPATFEGKDVVMTLAKTAEMNRDSIMKARRGDEEGVLSDDMLKSLATDLGVNGQEQVEMWKNRIPSEAFNAETILLMKSYLTQSALKLKDLSKKVVDKANVTDQQKVDFAKAYAEHLEVQDSFMGVRAEAGRALRAFGLKDEVTMNLEDTIAHIETGMSIDRIAETISMTDTVEGVSKAMEATRPKALQKIGNALHEMWINSILSGIKTQIVNSTGSALNLGMHKIDVAVGSLMGKNPFGRDVLSEADYIGIDEVLSAGFAQASVMQEAYQAAMKVVRTTEQYAGLTGEAGSSKLEVQSQAISSKAFGFDEASPIGRMMDMAGTVIRVPTERIMGGADGFFRVLAEQQSVHEQAFRMARTAERDGLKTGKEVQEYLQELIASPTPEMREKATEFAQRVVFQQDSDLAKKFISLISAIPTGRWIVPFVRTPLNLVSQAFLDRSPVGLLSERIRADLIAGGTRGQIARSRMVTGSAIALGFYTMAYNGDLTGSQPQDKARRDAWYQAGIKPRSFRFENEDGTVSYISYDRLEPFSFLFGAAADIAALQRDLSERADYRDEELENEKLVTGLIIAFANNVLDKTFMTGIQDAMTALTRGGDSFDRWARNYVASTVPYSGLRRDMTKFMDDTIRVSEDLGTDIQKNALGMASELPPKLDIYGEVVRYDHILGIWKQHYRTTDKVRLEVARLANEIKSAPISQIGRTIGGVKLNAAKYNELINLSRQQIVIGGYTFKDAVKNAMNGYMYSQMTDEDRINFLQSLRRKYDERARAEFLSNNVEIAEQVEKLKMIRQGNRAGL